ncbi:hypothetical protein BH23ACT5_BH23ACT5_17870 [soil metagenome]
MSDLSAAAAAMEVPEALVERSARASAEATGQSYDEVLAAWAGGEAVSSSPAPAPEPETPPSDTSTDTTPAESPPSDTPEVAPPAAPPAATSAPAAPRADTLFPPILESDPDRPLVTVLGGLAVVILVLLLGFVFPSLPEAGAEVRSSNLALSEQAQEGRHVYLRAGCASCHTQAVRSVVADVGLGPVTLADTNQVIGYRRIGPDLSDVGSRMTSDQISSLLAGGAHPPLVLSEAATASLVAYLAESATSIGPPPDGEGTVEEPDAEDEGVEP